MSTIIGYKGFGKDFKCLGKQYEVGKTYVEEKAEIGQCGIHFCTIPFDVFKYYRPGNSRYALVRAYGKVSASDQDSNMCTKKLKILRELTLKEIISEQEKVETSYVINTADYSHSVSTKNYAVAATKGIYSHAIATECGSRSIATGYRSHAVNIGPHSLSVTKGDESIAVALGRNSAAAAPLGQWIVLADWRRSHDGSYHLHGGQWLLVDGEKIKPDTLYTLRDGVPVIAEFF